MPTSLGLVLPVTGTSWEWGWDSGEPRFRDHGVVWDFVDASGLLSKLAVVRSRRPFSRAAIPAQETPRVPGRSPASHRAGPANGGLEAAGRGLFEDHQRRS